MKLSGLDMNLVIALDALLRERTVTRAAKAIGLEQSSMSHVLGRLRAHFDDPLFVKVGRDLVATERARALAEPVTRALAELSSVFLNRHTFEPATSTRTFHIAAPDNAEFYLLPRLLPALMAEAPHVQIRFHAVTDGWEHQLRHGDLDLKLGRRAALAPGLNSDVLFEEEFGCYVRRQHPLARKRVTLADYADAAHLVVKPNAGFDEPVATHVDGLLAREGKKRRIVATVPHFLVAPVTMATTDLVLTAAVRLVEPFLEHFGLARLAVPFTLPSYRLTQVWAQRADADPTSHWLRSLVARSASEPQRKRTNRNHP